MKGKKKAKKVVPKPVKPYEPLPANGIDYGKLTSAYENGSKEVRFFLLSQVQIKLTCRVCGHVMDTMMELMTHKRKNCRLRMETGPEALVNALTDVVSDDLKESMTSLFGTPPTSKNMRDICAAAERKAESAPVLRKVPETTRLVNGYQMCPRPNPQNGDVFRKDKKLSEKAECSAVLMPAPVNKLQMDEVNLRERAVNAARVFDEEHEMIFIERLSNHPTGKCYADMAALRCTHENCKDESAFQCLESLSYHITAVHPVPHSVYQCLVCGTVFETHKTLRAHVETAHYVVKWRHEEFRALQQNPRRRRNRADVSIPRGLTFDDCYLEPEEADRIMAHKTRRKTPQPRKSIPKTSEEADTDDEEKDRQLLTKSGYMETLVAIPAVEKTTKDSEDAVAKESKETNANIPESGPGTSKATLDRPKHTWCYPRQTARRHYSFDQKAFDLAVKLITQDDNEDDNKNEKLAGKKAGRRGNITESNAASRRLSSRYSRTASNLPAPTPDCSFLGRPTRSGRRIRFSEDVTRWIVGETAPTKEKMKQGYELEDDEEINESARSRSGRSRRTFRNADEDVVESPEPDEDMEGPPLILPELPGYEQQSDEEESSEGSPDITDLPQLMPEASTSQPLNYRKPIGEKTRARSRRIRCLPPSAQNAGESFNDENDEMDTDADHHKDESDGVVDDIIGKIVTRLSTTPKNSKKIGANRGRSTNIRKVLGLDKDANDEEEPIETVRALPTWEWEDKKNSPNVTPVKAKKAESAQRPVERKENKPKKTNKEAMIERAVRQVIHNLLGQLDAAEAEENSADETFVVTRPAHYLHDDGDEESGVRHSARRRKQKRFDDYIPLETQTRRKRKRRSQPDSFGDEVNARLVSSSESPSPNITELNETPDVAVAGATSESPKKRRRRSSKKSVEVEKSDEPVVVATEREAGVKHEEEDSYGGSNRRKQDLRRLVEDEHDHKMTRRPVDLSTIPVFLSDYQKEQFFSRIQPLTDDPEGPHRCNECNMEIENLRMSRRHIVGHARVIRLRCSLCKTGAFFVSDMRNHLMFKHCQRIRNAPDGVVHPTDIPCMSRANADQLTDLVDAQSPGCVSYTSGTIVSMISLSPYIPDARIEERIIGCNRLPPWPITNFAPGVDPELAENEGVLIPCEDPPEEFVLPSKSVANAPIQAAPAPSFVVMPTSGAVSPSPSHYQSPRSLPSFSSLVNGGSSPSSSPSILSRSSPRMLSTRSSPLKGSTTPVTLPRYSQATIPELTTSLRPAVRQLPMDSPPRKQQTIITHVIRSKTLSSPAPPPKKVPFLVDSPIKGHAPSTSRPQTASVSHVAHPQVAMEDDERVVAFDESTHGIVDEEINVTN